MPTAIPTMSSVDRFVVDAEFWLLFEVFTGAIAASSESGQHIEYCSEEKEVSLVLA